uniref:Carbonic anhydrase n=1 Tax=Oryzias latipes TaxID=8090 RepID=A0A3P9IQG0_ORYLA
KASKLKFVFKIVIPVIYRVDILFDHWETEFPHCGGLHQSPINIVTRKVHVTNNLPPLIFIGYTDITNITVENKGHSVRLTGGALPGYYRAAQFHFHWGGKGRPGSEHTIDGERFPMELHIVHIKEPYSSLAEAQHDMAVCVSLELFFFYFSLSPGSTTVIPNFRLSDIIPPASDLHHYYRYVGSMTTPGCEHAVAWTVFHRTLSISSRQQCRFWTGLPMTDIYRPTQPLDDRIVYSTNSGTAPKSVIHLWNSFFLAVLLTSALTQ